MQTNSILISEMNPEQLISLVSGVFKTQLNEFKKELLNQNANDDLMDRAQVLDFLKVDASTLVRWQNNKKIIVHKFANKNFYKRSEIMQCLTQLK